MAWQRVLSHDTTDVFSMCYENMRIGITIAVEAPY